MLLEPVGTVTILSRQTTITGQRMQPLYPSIKCYNWLDLAVDDVHTLYIEESGSPDGIPVLFVHGGPGAGRFLPEDRRFFDLERYRIILFDQRVQGAPAPMPS